jgi:hypothetical protein
MTRDMLLAFGIAMSSATQWRLPNLPLGLGDMCIGLWIGITFFGLLAGRATPQVEALFRLATFWILFAFALSIGALVGFTIEYQVAVEPSLHDTFAYLLMATMTCLAVSTADAPARFRRMAWLLILFSSVGLAVQIAAGWDIVHLPSVNPWYWDRFRGWSENPNQVAINSCILSLLALHLATTSSTTSGRLLGLLGAVAPLVAGRLSKSDTFISVMIFSGVVLFLLQLRRWVTASKYSSDLRYSFVLLAVLLALPMAISLLPFAKAGANDAESFALGLAKDKGGAASERTLDLRLYLWNQALTRGIHSGSLGLGPGPHLDPPETSAARLLDSPFEAHNTALDVFLQGGIIALATLAGLIVSTAALLYRAKLDTLVALIIAIAIFSTAHFIIRQPVVWFTLALCISAGCAQTRLTPVFNARR